MKTIFNSLMLALLLLAPLAAADPQPIQQGQGHPFACADYSQGKVFLVSAAGLVEWEYPAPSCDDLWVLPSGNLLFVTGHGAKEVTRDKQVIFSYESKSEVYACQRLADGNTFIGECNAGRLLEVDPQAKILKELRLLPEGAGGLEGAGPGVGVLGVLGIFDGGGEMVEEGGDRGVHAGRGKKISI